MALHEVYDVYEVILYPAIRRLHIRFYAEGVDHCVAHSPFKADSITRECDGRIFLGSETYPN